MATRQPKNGRTIAARTLNSCQNQRESAPALQPDWRGYAVANASNEN